jgi:hypothetical protein
METTNADEKNLRFAIYYSRSQQKKNIYIYMPNVNFYIDFKIKVLKFDV